MGCDVMRLCWLHGGDSCRQGLRQVCVSVSLSARLVCSDSVWPSEQLADHALGAPDSPSTRRRVPIPPQPPQTCGHPSFHPSDACLALIHTPGHWQCQMSPPSPGLLGTGFPLLGRRLLMVLLPLAAGSVILILTWTHVSDVRCGLRFWDVSAVKCQCLSPSQLCPLARCATTEKNQAKKGLCMWPSNPRFKPFYEAWLECPAALPKLARLLPSC